MRHLYEIKAGERFTYGGIEWIVLSVRPDMSLCLAADVLKDENSKTRLIPFDTENKNDFAASSIRSWLNEGFLNELTRAGADKEAFSNITLDLTSDDGLEDYGSDTVKIGLITCDMYRHFRKLIPNASDWWWTCTPFSTAKNGDSYSVRYVSTSGALINTIACCGLVGVRPLCVLKSDILVSVSGEEDYESVSAEPKMGWISIADKLPKNEGLVLVHLDNGFRTTVVYDEDFVLWEESGEVTHWMPLPPPPREVEP